MIVRVFVVFNDQIGTKRQQFPNEQPPLGQENGLALDRRSGQTDVHEFSLRKAGPPFRWLGALRFENLIHQSQATLRSELREVLAQEV